MELQFHKTIYPCLRQIKWETQNQEQTQEVRLADEMPDIGRVLGAWGQVLMRGKEWRSGSMQVSGGVMVWILYAPEEGGQSRSIETWIPFQMKWDLPDTERDGTIRAHCRLRSVDARSIAARKLMVRATVSVLAEALLPVEQEVFIPTEVPEDVQLLKNTYPVKMPKEAGEKPFAVEEVLSLPGSMTPVEKVLRCSLQPEIVDQKVMGDKVVFRGSGMFHMLYQGTDENLYSWDCEMPFSQYAELDGSYGQDAAAYIIPAVTSLELDRDEEGQLRVKAGLTGQYVIHDRQMVEVAEDAYSPRRKVTPQMVRSQQSMALDESSQTIHAEQSVPVEGTRVVDMAFYPEHGRVTHNENGAIVEMPGQFQMLYYDMEGNLQSVMQHWEDTWEIPAAPDTVTQAAIWPSGIPQGTISGGNAGLRADILLNTMTFGQQGIPMMTALELGELEELDPGRPSLILRKAGNNRLWDLAKSSGSTVQAIQEANRLTGEPDTEQMLLIPVS